MQINYNYSYKDSAGSAQGLFQNCQSPDKHSHVLREIFESLRGILKLYVFILRFLTKFITTFCDPQVERIVPLYHKTDVLGLQAFLREKFKLWAGNYQAALKRLSKELLVAKRNAQETFLRSVLQNEGSCWTEFYKYVKRRTGNRENIPALKDHNGKLITQPIEKANTLNSYYASIFSCERTCPQIPSTDSGKPFTVSTNIIRKRPSATGKKKSFGPDGIPGQILKLGGEAMIPDLARLLEITMNNNAIPGDWKKTIVVPIYKGTDRAVVGNYRPVSLTSVVCK
jgi:hypothetical protein